MNARRLHTNLPTRCRLAVLLPAVVVALVHVSVLPGVARAQPATEVYARRFDVTIAIEPAGTITVAETQEIVFPATRSYRSGFRWIPLDRVAGIRDVQVEEPGVRYVMGSGPYSYAVSAPEGKLRIEWRFPPTQGQARTFIVRYRVDGGLRIYPDWATAPRIEEWAQILAALTERQDQLWWKAIYDDRPYPVEAASVQVQFPAPVHQSDLKWEVYPSRLQVQAEQPDAATLLLRAPNGLAASEGMELRVQFPHGLVQAAPPAWQVRPLVILGLVLLTVLIGLVGALAVFLTWYLRGRKPAERKEPPVLAKRK